MSTRLSVKDVIADAIRDEPADCCDRSDNNADAQARSVLINLRETYPTATINGAEFLLLPISDLGDLTVRFA